MISRTFCGNCDHPMHWHECGAGADLTVGPCRCRNDQSTIAPTPEASGLREALLVWFDTTHGNGFGHDHHCPAPWSDEPYTQPIFNGCTCGWSDVQRADQARSRAVLGETK